MNRMNPEKALVVLSGGQDSTTVTYWAKERGWEVHAVTFNYGQRHALELEAARKVGELAGVKSHEFITLGPVLVGSSPLVNKAEKVGHYATPDDLPGGVEPTFVPGRNLLFLVIAANRAVQLGAMQLVTGVAAEDFGGYPDCTQPFVDSMEHAINQGFFGTGVGDKGGNRIVINTPLMFLKKSETVQMAQELPGCMEALAWSMTDYDGQFPPIPFNHSSMLRARGFHEAGAPDPLIERAIKEGKLPADYPTTGFVVGSRYADPATYAETLAAALSEQEEDQLKKAGALPS